MTDTSAAGAAGGRLAGGTPSPTARDDLRAIGFAGAEDIGQAEISERHVAGRSDGPRVGGLARLGHARA